NPMATKIVTFEPSGLKIDVDETTTIIDAARRLGLHLPSECGGHGTCGKCLVSVEPPPLPSEVDRTYISESDIKKGIRLACQHRTQRDIHVAISQTIDSAKILVDSVLSSAKWNIDRGLENQKGIAIDLGTTTIVAYLLDLETGTQIGHAASLNPQIMYGEDVMSRITYAVVEAGGADALKDAVLRRIEELIIELTASREVGLQNLSRLVIVGNPAMHHLLLGLDTKSLGMAPYEPITKNALNMSGEELGFATIKDVGVYLPPNIAGFVGGDTAAFILSQRLDTTDKIVLGIDVGTNGEIILSIGGELFCCSAAAGCAFEGATIRHGMRAQEGAIEHFSISDPLKTPQISVIGDGEPKGICGSGIVDIVAELKLSGIIESNGKMLESSRVIDLEGEKAYTITKPSENKSHQLLILTQNDVRQVQLAKGAILAGASILMESAGVKVTDIDMLLLAGAFGNYINPKSALAIGLLPPVGTEKVIPIGNAAGEGAKRMLLSLKERDLIESVVKRVKYLELAQYSNFARIFSRSTILEGKMPF
ncbi:MAG: ASKHA domain-containing protein, partial [Candidatus Sifarchaeia archaeon]